MSLQVHPDDAYAKKHENCNGKCEAWYFIDVTQDTRVSLGFLPGVDEKKFWHALKIGLPESVVHEFAIERGEAAYIRPGVIHTVKDGAVIAEIQQDSDITYRVSDYVHTRGDEPRELHIDKAKDVLNYDYISDKLAGVKKITDEHIKFVEDRALQITETTGKAQAKTLKAATKHIKKTPLPFTMCKYDYRIPIHEYSINRFRILSNVEGYGTIISPDGLFEDVSYAPGTTILIPASVPDFSLVPATSCVMIDIIPGEYEFPKYKKRVILK